MLDFTAKLWLAPRKARFLRTHWISLLGLLVPTLRIFSFLRLARLGRALPAVRAVTTSTRAARSGTRLFRSCLSYLAGLTSIGTLTLAELAYLAESRPHGTLPTFWSALIWASATVVGQSLTVNPVTGWGQLLLIAGLGLGVVTISTLAGAVGAYLLRAPDSAR